jgi:putative acetyltransferase
MSKITSIIKKQEPTSPEVRMMMDALWGEIQTRYGFTAPNPVNPESFAVKNAGCWIAWVDGAPVGGVALEPLTSGEMELDMMYVKPSFRGTNVAHQLIQAAEQHAKANGFHIIKLRAGAPQPEALRFYEKEGYTRIPVFGKWVFDDTAICFAKRVK